MLCYLLYVVVVAYVLSWMLCGDITEGLGYNEKSLSVEGGNGGNGGNGDAVLANDGGYKRICKYFF